MSTAALPFRRVTPQSAVLLGIACLAWLGTVIEARQMGVMPGTMGLGLPAFLVVWTPMMAAMMLPAVAPLASMYSRSVTARRPLRLGGFAGGYLLIWALAGLPAFALALLAGRLADGHPIAATAAASATFAACGVYQLSPLKHRCLRHCRSPLVFLLRYGSYRGTLRDLRAGVHHGAYCLGCCWSLFALLITVGVMNVPAMVALAAVVIVEKRWSGGEAFSRAVGVAAIALALAVIWFPELAPGLHGGMGTDTPHMSMETPHM